MVNNMEMIAVQVLSTTAVISSMFAMIQWVRADIASVTQSLSNHKDDHTVHCKYFKHDLKTASA